ncbi:MAG TPA: hypothetical protein VHW67_04080 [Solirubrobacteraceae bacterium]|jgi:serine O-acetyltransferase|nr:hypothetical protein [Solirubrobacteraceae bacterium]
MSPLRLWMASIALQRRGLGPLAAMLARLNAILYGNSLSPRASVGPGLWLGHHAFGLVVQGSVSIGAKATLWHNASLEAHGEGAALVIEDDVHVGAGSVISAAPGQTLRVGRGARIGAGAVVMQDIAPGATVVAARTRVLEGGEQDEERA